MQHCMQENRGDKGRTQPKSNPNEIFFSHIVQISETNLSETAIPIYQDVEGRISIKTRMKQNW